MRKVFEYRIGDLYIRRQSVWEEKIVNMLKERIIKEENGGKDSQRKLIDAIMQAMRGVSDLTYLSSEMQYMIKEAADLLATKGVNIQPFLVSGKSVKA